MAQFNPDLLLKDELSYEALLRGLPSVSYTHLDVYKRQRRVLTYDVVIDV